MFPPTLTGAWAISWRVFCVMESLTRWWRPLWSTAQGLMRVSVGTTLCVSPGVFLGAVHAFPKLYQSGSTERSKSNSSGVPGPLQTW